MRVQSLASISGLRIQGCDELWCRLALTAPILPLSWELPYASGVVRHMEVPRLACESELQLQDYTTATAMPDPSRICDPHHSSRQCGILNPLSEVRDGTCNFTVTNEIHFYCLK